MWHVHVCHNPRHPCVILDMTSVGTHQQSNMHALQQLPTVVHAFFCMESDRHITVPAWDDNSRPNKIEGTMTCSRDSEAKQTLLRRRTQQKAYNAYPSSPRKILQAAAWCLSANTNHAIHGNEPWLVLPQNKEPLHAYTHQESS